MGDDTTFRGVFIHYALGNKTQYSRKGIISVEGVDLAELGKLVGWYVGWPEKFPKMYGRITGFHGKNKLMVQFKHGLPGKAIGNKVIIKQGRGSGEAPAAP